MLGDTGIGKSALAAHFAKTAMMEGHGVLYHCVGCTADSLYGVKILARIVHALRGPNHPDKSALPEDTSELYPLLKDELDKWRESDQHLLIVIDGLNECHANDSHNALSWLPVRFPDNIRCIITVSSKHMPSVARVRDRQVLNLHIGPLDVATSQAIAQNFFKNYNKQLDVSQLESLLHKVSAVIPLWLSLACEELRIFGDFRMLTKKITNLPEGLGPLLQEILGRLVREDKTGHINKVLCLVFCSQDGIPESEICRLLGNTETRTQLTLLDWSSVRRQLKPFIHVVTYWYNGVLKIQFIHDAVREAVRELLVRSEAEEMVWHQYLAEYYELHCDDPTYTLEDLPYHLYKGGLWKRLAHFYKTDRRSIAGSPHFRQKYLNLIRCERHTPDMKNLSRPVKICQFCANRTGFVSPMPFPAKSSCIICGAWIVSHPSTETVGRVCIRHFGRFGPTTDQCFFCERIIQGGVGGTANPGLICHMCTTGRNRQRCARIRESMDT